MVPVTVLLQSGVRSSNLGTGRDSRVHLEASILLGGVLKRNAVILDTFFGMIRAVLDHRLFEFRPRDVKGRELDHNSANGKTYDLNIAFHVANSLLAGQDLNGH